MHEYISDCKKHDLDGKFGTTIVNVKLTARSLTFLWKTSALPCLATAKTVADVKCGIASSEAAASICETEPFLLNHFLVCQKISFLYAQYIGYKKHCLNLQQESKVAILSKDCYKWGCMKQESNL